MLPVATLINSINELLNELLTEAYAGPPDPRSTWFIDNEPDSGILGLLKNVSAAEASLSVNGSADPGTTIASNAEHLRWSLANTNATLQGITFNNNWKESWELLTVDEQSWEGLRSDLFAEFEKLQEALKMQKELPSLYLNGVLALLPHAAYHLGTIRQMIERVRHLSG